jgi:hypothetical protein
VEEQFYKISDFAVKVGRHQNTVDGWFKKLEEQYIHYVNRANNEKVYDTLDLEIALYIKERRDKKWTLDAIFDSLEDHFDLRPFPLDEEKRNDLLDLNALRRQITEEIRKGLQEAASAEIQQIKVEYEERFQEQLNLVKEQYENIIKQLPAPADQHQKKQQDITDFFTRRRVESSLRREALDLWSQKPLNERLIKVGLFSKIEDVNKRDQFVEEYIEKHLKVSMEKEYGITE